MLRNALILSSSGLLLFVKEWVKGIDQKKINLFSGLLRSLQEYSKQSFGLPLTFLQFATTGITIVEDNSTGLICVLLHDFEDGEQLGNIIATHILSGFVDEYSNSFNFTNGGLINQSLFRSYANKLADVIGSATKGILYQLKEVRGIQTSLLYDDKSDTSEPISTDVLEDQLGIAANLKALIGYSRNLMLAKKDSPNIIYLEMSQQIIQVSHVWQQIYLVCISQKAINPSTYQKNIESAISQIQKILEITSNLQEA
eukprot:TRINITY_DN2999_c0_g1_i1.p1 TRINITY_DN2999_c0_g1~~TRINITY_DN2999_c0_g1_i1.p1  ORF type:complete len:256 (-),score=100.74 TRINITY_DN2999_c0_g1_i1:51-818(-)